MTRAGQHHTGATARLALTFLLTSGFMHPALGGFKTECRYTSEWSNSDRRIEGTESPLSGCQADMLGMSSTNHILIGGSGSAEIVGIPAGGDEDGCEHGNECMEWCQALCCMAPGCKYATIREDTKTEDYVVYKETVHYYYCRMYSSGTHKDSGSQSTCTKLGSNYCDELAYDSFKLNSASYQQMVSAGAYATCPSSGRRLQATIRTKIPSGARIQATIRSALEPFAAYKHRARQAMRQGKMKRIMKSSGVCRYALT